jgi:predicted nucleic acid-binding protein
MRSYYFDSSALVKLFVTEAGSQWVDRIVNERGPDKDLANLVTTVQVGIVEIASAIARCQREGRISPEEQSQLFYSLQNSHQQIFQTLAITTELINLATRLTQKHVLRGYDAVHLAAASIFQRQISQAGFAAITFVSADRQLCQAAIIEGLYTINPDDLPEN